jgi:NAD(P)-dependent dehydrogenase (short-subunit alcohol dehydrogenase family)
MKSHILITGATSDIGISIANELANHKNLLLSGRNKTALITLKNSLPNPERHLIWQCDLGKEDVRESIKNSIEQHEITISEYIHAAGLFNIKPLRLFKKEDIDLLFNINVLSAIQISSFLSEKKQRAFLKNILFMSSISAQKGQRGYTVYAASKASLSGFMRSLAVELAPVNVNTLLLGAIKTRATQAIIESKELELNASIPLGLGTSKSIADWIVFLVSQDNIWMTGQEIVIDGGATLV